VKHVRLRFQMGGASSINWKNKNKKGKNTTTSSQIYQNISTDFSNDYVHLADEADLREFSLQRPKMAELWTNFELGCALNLFVFTSSPYINVDVVYISFFKSDGHEYHLVASTIRHTTSSVVPIAEAEPDEALVSFLEQEKCLAWSALASIFRHGLESSSDMGFRKIPWKYRVEKSPLIFANPTFWSDRERRTKGDPCPTFPLILRRRFVYMSENKVALRAAVLEVEIIKEAAPEEFVREFPDTKVIYLHVDFSDIRGDFQMGSRRPSLDI